MRSRSSPPRPGLPEVVAHRGCASRYPENTLLALRAALGAGARYVEVDVMLSRDGVPVLMHDATLLRTAGRAEEVADLGWQELCGIEVAERSRLGERGAGERVPSLRQFVELLGEWPAATAFVELKRAALRRHGTRQVVERVLAELEAVRGRTIVISFSAAAVRAARASGGSRIGWVVERYGDSARATARRLGPEFLFCNYEKVPPGPGHPWPGPWEWVLYELTDPALALGFAARGVRFIETMAVSEMLAALAAEGR